MKQIQHTSNQTESSPFTFYLIIVPIQTFFSLRPLALSLLNLDLIRSTNLLLTLNLYKSTASSLQAEGKYYAYN